MAFADAVVAIAITLLVLPLVDIPAEVATSTFGEVWQEHQAEFYMFLLSFVVIARIWLSHHNFGERMVRGDSWVLIMTLGWLLTVVFFPLPTEMMGELGNERGVAAVYIATLGANMTLLALMGRHLAARPAMWREGCTQRQMQVWVTGWWSNPLLCVAALALCLGVPGVGIWSLLLLFLDGPISKLALRRRGQPTSERDADPDPTVGTDPQRAEN
jgi:uncharacterized membrane protein